VATDDRPIVVEVPYQDRMALVYAAADVLVCRAGAMTVAELAAAGVPSILVPLPGAPGDHQTANARVLEQAGAALVLADAECTGDRLAALLDCLLAHPEGLDQMGRAAAALGRPDAALAGARVVEEHARPARRGGA
jgi:UDP-N-acetylglucosamine--N-acetylmuramyl-(pentapeptide) pyrophosphoryl-undecaprenol N-acetylglucosamine transferase